MKPEPVKAIPVDTIARSFQVRVGSIILYDEELEYRLASGEIFEMSAYEITGRGGERNKVGGLLLTPQKAQEKKRSLFPWRNNA